MIVVLIFEPELVVLLNEVLDKWIQIFDLFVDFIADVDLVHDFLDEFHHQRPIFHRSFIEHLDAVQVYCLVEDYVLDLTLGLQDQIAQLVVMEEEELELDALVLQKLNVVHPIRALFHQNFH